MSEILDENSKTGLEIAVIGMACRFPQAKNIEEFWENLEGGVECISFFSPEELEEAGVEEELLNNPNYIKAKGVLEGMAYFDSSFFDYTPPEAEVMDPQIRILLECSWEALEHAGYNPDTYKGLIGVYVGASAHPRWEAMALMFGDPNIMGHYTAHHLYDKDHINTRISYNLNLKGPSVNIQGACATTLTVVHLACQGLLSGECHMALVGGTRIGMAGKRGYTYEVSGILSPDGHCRAFDAKAGGTVHGEGAGIVVLKTFEKAIIDGDCIYAIIKGSAINNSGKNKAGYAAPSVTGQASVIRAALRAAQVKPETINYIETHGTGTSMGDSTEIAALTQVFNTDKKGFCRIGSVKPNLGHFDAGSGIASFIKVVLVLKNRLIPPSLHFEKSNPKIDFENSPFIVNTGLTVWKGNKYPLRAGVSSFGVGGAHAHVILEEASINPNTSTTRQWQLIVLSAKTESALKNAGEHLKEFLKKKPGINLADTAYTLQIGRKAFQHRSILLCADSHEAVHTLTSPEEGKISRGFVKNENIPVMFIFPSEGFQYVDMGLDLYRTEPGFRETMDHCFNILNDFTKVDIRKYLYPGKEDGSLQHSEYHGINQVEIAQPLIFIFEYALAKLLMKWGIKPDALIGHSIGEYVSACLAGIFSLEAGIKIAVLRGQLAQEMYNGTSKGALLKEFEEKITGIPLNKPQIPCLSSKTGKILNDREVLAHGHWIKHLEQDSESTAGVEELLNEKEAVLVKIGPGNVKIEGQIIHLVRHPGDNISDNYFLLENIGRLWLYGVNIDWSAFYSREKRYRVALPTYPFEHQYYPVAGDFLKTISEMLLKVQVGKKE